MKNSEFSYAPAFKFNGCKIYAAMFSDGKVLVEALNMIPKQNYLKWEDSMNFFNSMMLMERGSNGDHFKSKFFILPFDTLAATNVAIIHLGRAQPFSNIPISNRQISIIPCTYRELIGLKSLDEKDYFLLLNTDSQEEYA